MTAFFSLVLAFNTGAAFSFLAGAGGWQRWFFAAIAVVASVIIVWLLRRGGDRVYCLGLALILGGALGNLWDRLTLGKVVDFLLFHYAGWAYPAFNVADSAITVGAALLIIDSFRQRRAPRRPATPEKRLMDVLLANPRGFCAGVDRAIAIVEQALAIRRADLRAARGRAQQVRRRRPEGQGRGVRRGARRQSRPGSTVVFSAHGVAQAVRAEAEARGLRVFDATCPLVTKVHVEVAKMRAARARDRDDRPRRPSRGRGHDGPVRRRHLPRRVGRRRRAARGRRLGAARLRDADDAVGRRRGGDRRRAEARFPAIVGPKKDDICYATQNRQDAVKLMARDVDVVIVVGSPNSSNSNRLREVAANRGVPAYMVDRADELDPAWIDGAAASA